MEKHYFSFKEDDLLLMEYSNIFAANRIWMKFGRGNEIVTYDLVVRDMPKNWGYYIMFGLDRFLKYVKNLRFSKNDILMLKKMKLIDKEHVNFYKNFKFNGDIYAVPDGEIFFPKEPILRITGTALEVNLLTALAMNSFSYPIRIITKMKRAKIASGKANYSSGGGVRSNGMEQILISLTTNYVIGGTNSIQPILYKEHPELMGEDWKFYLNVNHALIKSFEKEEHAFDFALKEILPICDSMWVMIDTYDSKKGLAKYIEKIKNFSKEKQKRLVVSIDSGDIYKESIYIRKKLDEAKLYNVRISAYSNLDEYKIEKLVKRKAPIDWFVAITEVLNVTDHPKLELIFKVAESIKDGKITYKAKLTPGKESLPGRKQIFRIYNKKGKMIKDIIGLENEKINATPILEQFMKNGKLIKNTYELKKVKYNLEKNMQTLPEYLKKVYVKKKYKVEKSKGIKKIIQKLKKEHQ